MDIDAVKILDNADVPAEPVTPSLKKNGAAGGILGILLSIVVILFLYVTDDCIRTPEDVKRYLGFDVLGEIPASGQGKRKGRRRE